MFKSESVNIRIFSIMERQAFENVFTNGAVRKFYVPSIIIN
jgi:hypothetical protein